MKICSVEGCDKKVYCKNMCEKHYRQIKKHGRIIDDERRRSFINRIGEENYNIYGSLMKIIEYNKNSDITTDASGKIYCYGDGCQDLVREADRS